MLMESNIKDYNDKLWSITFVVECSSNFFALFFCIMIIIYSFKKKDFSEQDMYDKANVNSFPDTTKNIKENEFTFHQKNKNEIYNSKDMELSQINKNKENKVKEKRVGSFDKNKSKSDSDNESIEQEEEYEEEYESNQENESEEENEYDEMEEKEQEDEYQKNKIDMDSKKEKRYEEKNRKENKNEYDNKQIRNLNHNSESQLIIKDENSSLNNEDDNLGTLENRVKYYEFSTLENSGKKIYISIIVILIIMMNAYVNVESYYNLKPKFLETQFVLYDNGYLINSVYIDENSITNTTIPVYTNLQYYNQLKLNSNIDFSLCSKFTEKELKMIDLFFLVKRGRYAFLILSNFLDMIFLFFIFLSLFPNKIYDNVQNNSKLAGLLFFFLGNCTCIPVLSYYLFNLDSNNTCYAKYEYFEYFFYAFIIYGMYYALMLFFIIVYFFINNIFKMAFFITFIIFPFIFIFSFCLPSIRKHLLSCLIKWEIPLRDDVLCKYKKFSSIVVWLIIVLGMITCILSYVNFAILKYIHILQNGRLKYASYVSLAALALSIINKVSISCCCFKGNKIANKKIKAHITDFEN